MGVNDKQISILWGSLKNPIFRVSSCKKQSLWILYRTVVFFWFNSLMILLIRKVVTLGIWMYFLTFLLLIILKILWWVLYLLRIDFTVDWSLFFFSGFETMSASIYHIFPKILMYGDWIILIIMYSPSQFRLCLWFQDFH